MEPPPPRISVNTTPEAQRGRTFVIVFDDMNLTPFAGEGRQGGGGQRSSTSGAREGDHVTLIATGG